MDLFLNSIEQLLANTPEIYAGYSLLFGLSALLGLTHTFGPGHGKSLMLGVLVADSRRVSHALKMALVIGITHMTDVLVLSLVSIFIVSTIPIGTYSSVIGVVSGGGIFLIGLYRTSRVLRNINRNQSDSDSDESSHTHRKQSESENLMTAFLYSLAPCPGAWILFMACLGIGEPITGILLLFGFTLGLLVAISGIALSIVYSLEAIESMLPAWVETGISLLSGILVSLFGLWLMWDTQPHSHSS